METALRESEVYRAMNSLRDAINAVEAMASELNARLGPVINNAPRPVDPRATEKVNPEPSASPLVCDIRRATSQLHSVINSVTELFQVVEI
jgi:hypothetical protein